MNPPIEQLFLSCRQDAGEPEIQELLENAAKSGRWLGCGHCCDPDLRLFPFFDHEERGHNFRCGQNERPRHAPDCFVNFPGGIFDQAPPKGVCYTANIFAQVAPHVPSAPRPFTGNVGSGVWYGNLTHLINACLMEASISAFRNWNRGLGHSDHGIAAPPLDEIFSALGERLRSPLLVGGESPALAARRLGLRIFFGTTRTLLVEDLREQGLHGRSIDLSLDDAWDSDGRLAGGSRFHISPTVGSAAAGKTMAYGNVIPPPYLVVGAATRSGDVVRLIVVPIAPCANLLLTAESAVEQWFLALVVELGAAIIKPCINTDLRELGAQLWPFRTNQHGFLPHRPDALVYFRGRVWIVEVAGSIAANYNQIVDARLARIRDLVGPETGELKLRKVPLADVYASQPLFSAEMLG